MSWVEAAWTVKKIQQNLEIPSFINSYVNQINTLNSNIITLGAKIPSETEIQTVEQTAQLLSDINSNISTANTSLNSLLENGDAFIATSINNQPNIQRNITKNTVWFISEA